MAGRRKHAVTPLKRFAAFTAPRLAETFRTPLYRIIAGIFLAYTAAAACVILAKHLPVEPGQFIQIVFAPLAVLLFAMLYSGWPGPVKRRLDFLFNDANVVQGFVTVFIFELFFSVFMTIKMFISTLVPFWADPLLSDLDAALHFGRHPWEWLWPLVGHAPALMTLDFLYTLWLLMQFVVVFWQAFSLKKPEVRATFFLAYMATWIVIGTGFALMFSSAGPCYFHHVAPKLPDPYKEQMDFLKSVHDRFWLGAAGFQEVLWRHHAEGNHGPLNGISAFPSMHLSGATLFFLVARAYGKIPARIFGFYLFAILLGSIALGWHYALDGYFSIPLTVLLWLGCGWLVRRFELWKPRRARK